VTQQVCLHQKNSLLALASLHCCSFPCMFYSIHLKIPKHSKFFSFLKYRLLWYYFYTTATLSLVFAHCIPGLNMSPFMQWSLEDSTGSHLMIMVVAWFVTVFTFGDQVHSWFPMKLKCSPECV
jgi:hypothetical protein